MRIKNVSGPEEVYSVIDRNKLKGKAEQFRGQVEQAVGKATGSEKTRAGGQVHEAKGKARETLADVKSEMTSVIGKAMDKVAETRASRATAGKESAR
jgi:uncharacterized protein YjbJ (UPF0337 family)